jgi:crotonobetainyl-CoA:carnitine CoA-transferase CaiB-like acyl-CoA transferase
MVGPARAGSCAEIVAAAREARLLLGAVRAPAPPSSRDVGDGRLAGALRRDRRRPRVVDWTVLWAGPWAAQELRRSGALVERIEHPRRRDGLLGWPAGRSWWRRLNAGKRLSLLDAGRDGDRARLDRSLRDADVLITSMTPRALRSLGFDDAWRAEHAPRLLHVELVAFDEPWADAPGLGEHAAAEAGLLWGGCDGPRPPYPWGDPLLGAAALVLAQAWLASDRARGGRVRLSLEGAASLAFGVETLQAA